MIKKIKDWLKVGLLIVGFLFMIAVMVFSILNEMGFRFLIN
jgi:hypothetical protein